MRAILPILMYHQVLPRDDPRFEPHLAVTPQTLGRQIGQLRRLGFRLATLSEACGALASGRGRERLAALTFDDLTADFIRHALPVLASSATPATLFAIGRPLQAEKETDGDDNRRFVQAAEARKLAAMGFEIGAHGMTHRVLTSLPDRELLEELVASRALISEIAGRETFAVAYPSGRFTPRVLAAAAVAGYRFGCTCLRGNVQQAEELLVLKRIIATERRLGLRLWYATTWLYDCWHQERCRRERRAWLEEEAQSIGAAALAPMQR
ncbi:MAG: polysaccharide deacetylase family protein [Planctomycetota bacterium]|nr:polysaccharide deacetylase family protein [Planctomycetota bacterium]